MTGRLLTDHTHPCRVCRAPVACAGDRFDNHDGFPTIICESYHLPGGVTATVRCDACAAHARIAWAQQRERHLADRSEQAREDAADEAFAAQGDHDFHDHDDD